MKYRFPASIGAAFLGVSASAWAQSPGGSYGHDMMMGGWGWSGMIFGPIMMIAVLATVVIVIVLVVRWLGGGYPSAHMRMQRPEKTALDILKERFAKGEIDKDEFEERRRVLGD